MNFLIFSLSLLTHFNPLEKFWEGLNIINEVYSKWKVELRDATFEDCGVERLDEFIGEIVSEAEGE